MKKLIIGSALLGSLAFSFAGIANAQVATTTNATSTPMLGGHRHQYLAGFVDSIHNKAQWLLSNTPALGRIYYISENPEKDPIWQAVIKALNYR